MRRSLVGRRNDLCDSLDIFSYSPSGLRRDADQARHAGLLIDRRAPPAIRLGVLQDRAVELWPVGAFTAGMQSASDSSCLGHAKRQGRFPVLSKVRKPRHLPCTYFVIFADVKLKLLR
jgi:hypothetical protein